MKILSTGGLIVLLVFLSCKGEIQKDELDMMYDEVMAIHDEVMPKMRDINRAKKGLKKIEGYEDDPVIINKMKELDDADEVMMAWMAAFKKPKKSDLEAAKAYYIEQLDDIKGVRKVMLMAIESANILIEAKTPAE